MLGSVIPRPVWWALSSVVLVAAIPACDPDSSGSASPTPEPGVSDRADAGSDGGGTSAGPGSDHGPVPVGDGAGSPGTGPAPRIVPARGVDGGDTATVTPADVPAAEEAGWHRRRVAGQPVLVAGQGAEPLTVELAGLQPQRRHHVTVGYVLGLAGGVTSGWGVRARVAGYSGDFARLDHRARRHQPDPANPWIFEAPLGRPAAGADGRVAVELAPVDGGAQAAVAYVRASRSPPLDRSGAPADAPLRSDGSAQVPATTTGGFPSAEDYLTVLQRWPAHASGGFTAGYRGDADLGYFGSGVSSESGMRSLGNFIYTYAVLAQDQRYDPSVSGVDRVQLRRRARMALRYMARTHRSGDLEATDGRTWGHHWQSSWWASRLAGGASLLWEHLDAHERSLVQRVITAEADRQRWATPPSATPGDSKAEENAWNTEVLAWALALWPDHPHAGAWREALSRWAVNALSVAGDGGDDTMLAGRPVSAWSSTVNVNDDFTIENHGAYHAGYMAWPLQSLTWSYYALSAADQPVPDALLHNYRAVWRRLASTYLGGGRFAYLGGKDWPQHVYGSYAIVPPTVLLQHLDGDELAATVEADRLRLLEWEQRLWGDGSFFGGRLAGDAYSGWNAVFDSDAAALLAMAHHLDGVLDGGGDGTGEAEPAALDGDQLAQRLPDRVTSTDSAFVMARGGGLTTGFGWRTLECCFSAVTGDRDVLGVVSAGDPHMVAWREGQLAGDVSLAGVEDAPRGVSWHETRELARGGYATMGVRWIGGSAAAPAITQQLAMVSLPGSERAVVLDQPVAARSVEVSSSTGLDLAITNDIFNQLTRHVTSGGQRRRVASGDADRVIGLAAPWANIDGRLGVAYDGTAGRLELATMALRTRPWGGLRHETLRWRADQPGGRHAPGTVLRRLVFGFHAGGPRQTRELSQGLRLLATGDAHVTAAVVPGGDGGGDTVVAANFAAEPRQLTLELGGEAPAPTVQLPGRSVRIVSQRDDAAGWTSR